MFRGPLLLTHISQRRNYYVSLLNALETRSTTSTLFSRRVRPWRIVLFVYEAIAFPPCDVRARMYAFVHFSSVRASCYLYYLWLSYLLPIAHLFIRPLFFYAPHPLESFSFPSGCDSPAFQVCDRAFVFSRFPISYTARSQ